MVGTPKQAAQDARRLIGVLRLRLAASNALVLCKSLLRSEPQGIGDDPKVLKRGFVQGRVTRDLPRVIFGRQKSSLGDAELPMPSVRRASERIVPNRESTGWSCVAWEH